MENFTNQTIDLASLPKFEEVTFNRLHPDYWKIICIGMAIAFVILGVGSGLAIAFAKGLAPYRILLIVAVILLMAMIFFFSRISFHKKGYAFRNHDVLFRHGIIATNTIIIPYNRIQHVALHEGLLARFFGLAEVQIFTAGGKDSDIMIPGIEKSQAEQIKQLLMGKIQKQL